MSLFGAVSGLRDTVEKLDWISAMMGIEVPHHYSVGDRVRIKRFANGAAEGSVVRIISVTPYGLAEGFVVQYTGGYMASVDDIEPE